MATSKASAKTTSPERVFLTFQEAAKLIEVTPAEVVQAVATLGITPELCAGPAAGPEKRLQIIDVLVITAQSRRASVEEVAGGILALTKEPQQRKTAKAEIDCYFAALHQPAKPMPEEQFFAELESALPEQVSEQAKRIYRASAGAAA